PGTAPRPGRAAPPTPATPGLSPWRSRACSPVAPCPRLCRTARRCRASITCPVLFDDAGFTGRRSIRLATMGRPQTIDDYLEGFTGQRHDLLARLRGLAREAVPEAAEAIKWGNPSWVHPSGTILFMIAGYSRHANVAFTPSTREAFQDELTGWATGKGTI